MALDAKRVKQLVTVFLKEEDGQDLVEYTLLLAFVALASAGLFIGAGNSIGTIWTVANSTLANASIAAS